RWGFGRSYRRWPEQYPCTSRSTIRYRTVSQARTGRRRRTGCSHFHLLPHPYRPVYRCIDGILLNKMPSDQTVRVLIVDDEVLARQRLEDLLSGEENVEIVGLIDNGKQAVEEIRNLAPDIVFLDIQMPGKTGIEVLQE